MDRLLMGMCGLNEPHIPYQFPNIFQTNSMNNIFLNNDPLLYRNSTIQQPQDVNNIYQQAYRQQLMNEMS